MFLTHDVEAWVALVVAIAAALGHFFRRS